MQVFESLCQMSVIHVNICYYYLFWLWAVIKAYIMQCHQRRRKVLKSGPATIY